MKKTQDYAASNGIDILGKIPLNPEIAKLCDAGKAEEIENDSYDQIYRISK